MAEHRATTLGGSPGATAQQNQQSQRQRRRHGHRRPGAGAGDRTAVFTERQSDRWPRHRRARGSADHAEPAGSTARYGCAVTSSRRPIRSSGFSERLKNKDVTELLNDAQRLARRQPALFVGGAFALGLLGARFLKSSRRRTTITAIRAARLWWAPVPLLRRVLGTGCTPDMQHDRLRQLGSAALDRYVHRRTVDRQPLGTGTSRLRRVPRAVIAATQRLRDHHPRRTVFDHRIRPVDSDRRGRPPKVL